VATESLRITPVDPSLLDRLYTTEEVARLLRVSQKTVQMWIRAGTLPAMRYGRLWRIRQVDLVAFGEVFTTDAATPLPTG
jgi:excisionase family DNA binding protein